MYTEAIRKIKALRMSNRRMVLDTLIEYGALNVYSCIDAMGLKLTVREVRWHLDSLAKMGFVIIKKHQGLRKNHYYPNHNEINRIESLIKEMKAG